MSTEKLWSRDFILGAIINLFILVNYFVLMVVITDYALTTYKVGAALAGFAASVFIVGALFSRFTSSIAMAKFGPRRVLAAGIVAELVLSALYFIPMALPLLIALRFVHGFFYGLSSSTVSAIVTSIVPNERKGEGVGYFMLSTTLGAAIGPLVGMALSHMLGMQAVFIACFSTAALNMVALLGFRPKGVQAPKAAGARGLRAFIEPSALPISLVIGVMFFAYSTTLTYLSPFAQQEGLTAAANFFFVAYALATFVSRLFTGKLFDRKGPDVVMIPSFVSAAVAFMLIGFASNDAMLLCGAMFLGFGVGTIQSCGVTMAVQQASLDRLSFANSTAYALMDVGVGIGPVAMGSVQPLLGYGNLFASMAAMSLVGLTIYLLVSRKRARR